MLANFERYKRDLESLAERGQGLLIGMVVDTKHPQAKDLPKEVQKKALDFRNHYQTWYSEALRRVVQLLPDRKDDFVSYYKSAKPRQSVSYQNYTIEDYLQGLTITSEFKSEPIVAPIAAVPAFYQQLQIVDALKHRLESSLFDIRALVQADLFDSELDAAEELNKKGFERGAGAIAGVLLEGHLEEVCANHKVAVPKNPTISKLNDILKGADVIDQAAWRSIQHLGDLRNLWDHKRGAEPTTEQMGDLIIGTRKVTKTIL